MTNRQPILATRTLVAALFAFALLSVPAIATADDSLPELQKRFKERYPHLVELKKTGTFGETFGGYIEAVSGDSGTEKTFIDAENADRTALYKQIAAKEGTTEQKIAERNAVRNFDRAKAGENLKGKDGKWTLKK